MYKITKLFSFEASHQLVDMPDDHPCNRNHGHSYRVRVSLVADEPDALGMVTDYHNLSRIKAWIDENLDHRNLNEVYPFHTTAENMAASIYRTCLWILEDVPGFGEKWWLESVGISETVKTWAEYSDG